MLSNNAETAFNNNHAVDLETFVDILNGNIDTIYVLTRRNATTSYAFLAGIERLTRKDIAVRKYKWHGVSNEFRAYYGKKETRYHRIILSDLLRGTDANNNKVIWYRTKEEACLYAELK